MYRSFLRIGILVSAITLLFDGGFVVPITKQLSNNTFQYLGSVGSSMLASVEPNEINTLTAEITARQRELDARESALRAREIETRDFGQESSTEYSTYIIATVLFILTVLLLLNFAMDFARIRSLRYEKSLA